MSYTEYMASLDEKDEPMQEEAGAPTLPTTSKTESSDSSHESGFEKQFDEVFAQSELVPLSKDEYDRLMQLVALYPSEKKKHAARLEVLASWQKVIPAVDAWIELNDPNVRRLGPKTPQQQARERELVDIVNNTPLPSPEEGQQGKPSDFLTVAQDAKLMIAKGNLDGRTSLLHEKQDPTDYQAALAQRTKLQPVMDFATKVCKYPHETVEQPGKEWSAKNIEEQRQQALGQAQEIAMDLATIEQAVGGFRLTYVENGQTIRAEQKFPAEYAQRRQLEEKIDQLIRRWRLPQEQVYQKANAWKAEARRSTP